MQVQLVECCWTKELVNSEQQILDEGRTHNLFIAMLDTSLAIQLISLLVLFLLILTILILGCCGLLRLYDYLAGVEYVDMDKEDQARHRVQDMARVDT